MFVYQAEIDDIPSWLSLSAEVEDLFGAPMANDPGFQDALSRTIGRGDAYCVRKDDGLPGTAIAGAIMFSGSSPNYRIGWLAVARKSRGKGIGKLLVDHVVSLVTPPATINVTTFREDKLEGWPARKLYESVGFVPGELHESHGLPCQEFVKVVI